MIALADRPFCSNGYLSIGNVSACPRSNVGTGVAVQRVPERAASVGQRAVQSLCLPASQAVSKNIQN
jgi:hypothetical protein